MTITQILTHYISVLQKENKPSDDLRARDLQKVLDGVREKDEALEMAQRKHRLIYCDDLTKLKTYPSPYDEALLL